MTHDGPNITKKDIVRRVAARTGLKRAIVQLVVQALLEQIIEELKQGNRIELRDFGVFEVKQRAARTAQNPKTLERVPVPPKRAVRFKVGRRMRLAAEPTAPTAPEPPADHDPAGFNGSLAAAARVRGQSPEVHVRPAARRAMPASDA